mmetsp:Transcript_14792/g.62412  ORF Transcript_14792/g.62412 Transcript_14792/m.62412 type:complete len:247 (-) Transcript_14792:773-1513(-)
MYRDRRLVLPLRRRVVDDDGAAADDAPSSGSFLLFLRRGRLRSQKGSYDVDALPHAWHVTALRSWPAKTSTTTPEVLARYLAHSRAALADSGSEKSSFSSKYAGGVVTAFNASSSASSRNRKNSCESCWSPSVNKSRGGLESSARMNARGSCASRAEASASDLWMARTTRANSEATSEARRLVPFAAFSSHEKESRSTYSASGGVCASDCRHAAAKHVFPRFTRPRRPLARSNIATRRGGACGSNV